MKDKSNEEKHSALDSHLPDHTEVIADSDNDDQLFDYSGDKVCNYCSLNFIFNLLNIFYIYMYIFLDDTSREWDL